MKSTVSSKGQVTIPKKLRDRLGLRQGSTLEFHEEAGRLVAARVDADDPVGAVYGVLRDGRRTDEVLAEIRGTPDRP
jgi:antitoxin PrlF